MQIYEIALITAGYKLKPDLFPTVWVLQESKYEIECSFWRDGLLKSRRYSVDGKESRDNLDGPSYEYYNDNGQLVVRRFMKKGKKSRNPSDGPACETFHDNGQVYWEQYFVNDKAHRNPSTGPAKICFSQNGEVRIQEYWKNGKFVSGEGKTI